MKKTAKKEIEKMVKDAKGQIKKMVKEVRIEMKKEISKQMNNGGEAVKVAGDHPFLVDNAQPSEVQLNKEISKQKNREKITESEIQ